MELKRFLERLVRYTGWAHGKVLLLLLHWTSNKQLELESKKNSFVLLLIQEMVSESYSRMSMKICRINPINRDIELNWKENIDITIWLPPGENFCSGLWLVRHLRSYDCSCVLWWNIFRTSNITRPTASTANVATSCVICPRNICDRPRFLCLFFPSLNPATSSEMYPNNGITLLFIAYGPYFFFQVEGSQIKHPSVTISVWVSLFLCYPFYCVL